MFVKICKHCDRTFVSKGSQRIYCSYGCRASAESERLRKGEQLCWTCGKACGKCLWSAFALPIYGWDAKAIIVRDVAGDMNSYRIKKCPLYIKG